MIKVIILFFICVAMCVFAICAFIMAQAKKKERYKIQKQLNEVYEHEEYTSEIISNANKAKADARTGDHERDLDFMARKLHDYANK